MKRQRLMLVLAVALFVVLAVIAVASAAERFRYERRQKVDGTPYYVEIYEVRDTDLDSTAQIITTRVVTQIDKPAKLAALQAEKAAAVAQATALQARIDALTALP